MKFDLNQMFLAVGAGLAFGLILALKKSMSPLKLKDINYDGVDNAVSVTLENKSKDILYVRPSIRLIHFMGAEELRTENHSGIPMLPARAGVIKNHELLAESRDPVALESGKSLTFTYGIGPDKRLTAFDTLTIDSDYGLSPEMLNSKLHSVKPLIKTLMPDFIERNMTTNECLTFSGTSSSEPQENQIPSSISWSLPKKPVYAGEDVEDQELELEFIEGEEIELKPRHIVILKALESENAITSKELSKKIGRNRKSVHYDLQYLIKKNLVGRVKIGKTYKYYMYCLGERIVIGEDESDNSHNT
ncbi:MAG: HTH domain-containing protein [Candidatus Altiarchaeota archaeon]|nr:HTH domain-containing protein [Candidatus Altiarchaeota archaeon]